MSIDAVAGPPSLQPRLPYEPHATLGPITALALSLAIVLITVIVSTVGFFVVLAFAGNDQTRGDLLRYAFSDPSGQLALLVSTVAGQILAAIFCYWFAGFKKGVRSEVLALGAPRGGLVTYAVTTVVFLAAAIAIGFFVDKLFPHDMFEDLKMWLPLVHSAWAPLLFVAIVIGAPLWEELVFRGFLFPALARTRLGFAGAAVISSLFWSLLHWGTSVQGMTTIFLLGLVLAAILVRTGSLRVAIFCHAAYNAGAFFFMLYALPAPGA